MKQSTIEHETWLDLSHAASYLGVHFTTLRRWADAGEVACMRTPGGRRRFSVKALEAFVARSGSGRAEVQLSAPAAVDPCASTPAASSRLQDSAIDHARQSVRGLPADGSFLRRIPEEQRMRMRGTGQRLMALLIQYNSRCEGGDVFLDEGCRITREYSLVCREAGLSVEDTAQVFLFFRRSILDAIHETGYLGGPDDQEGARLYARSNDFLDQLLLDLIGSYMNEPVKPLKV